MNDSKHSPRDEGSQEFNAGEGAEERGVVTEQMQKILAMMCEINMNG
jgi:hypothetical protein